MTVMKTETVAQGHHVRPWRYSAFVDLTMSQTRSTPVYRGGSKHEKKKKTRRKWRCQNIKIWHKKLVLMYCIREIYNKNGCTSGKGFAL